MKPGISLIESIVTIAILVLVFSTVTATISTIPVNIRDQHYQQAYHLAQQQMDVVRSLPFSSLSNQTDGPFRHVAFPVGTIQVVADSAANSLPNVLELTNTETATPFSSLALLPENRYTDFTLTAQAKAKPNPPAGWKLGLVARYQDSSNYYWYYIDSTGIHFSRFINGAATSLYDQTTTINANTWYELKITASSSNWTLSLNGVQLTTLSDGTLLFGTAGLASVNRPVGQFDDIQITQPSNTTWNFDSDPVGSLPANWSRFGLNELPGAATTLSIENYSSSSAIKKITVKVTWNEKSSNQEVKLTSLITQ